jgi:hypothetical protein
MVKVTPLGTVKFAVTLYGPPAAVQVVFAANVPLAVAMLPSSNQTSTFVEATSTSFVPSDCTTNRFNPG